MSKGYLTTHVLDTYNGKPGSNINGQLFRVINDKKIKIKDFTLNSDGRCDEPILEKDDFIIGKYEINFFHFLYNLRQLYLFLNYQLILNHHLIKILYLNLTLTTSISRITPWRNKKRYMIMFFIIINSKSNYYIIYKKWL